MSKLNDNMLLGLLEQYDIKTEENHPIVAVENDGKRLSIRYPSKTGNEDSIEIKFSDNEREFRSLNAFYLEASREIKYYDALWNNKIQPEYFAKRVRFKDDSLHDLPAGRKLLQTTKARFDKEDCEIEIKNTWTHEKLNPFGISIRMSGTPAFAENLIEEQVLKEVSSYIGMKGILERIGGEKAELKEIPLIFRDFKGDETLFFEENAPSKIKNKKDVCILLAKTLKKEENKSDILFYNLTKGQTREVLRRLSPVIEHPSEYSFEFSASGSSANYFYAGLLPYGPE